ncbi:mRNA-capping enzyme [Linum perenne]
MDLNALPRPEDEEDNTERHVEEYSAPVETSVQLARREREERRIRLRNANSDDRHAHAPRQPVQGQNRLPPGWLDCPPAGKEICGIIPSKVPLGEMYYADVPPSKRYSSEQVIRRQRKIQCRGRDAVPENVAVNQFVMEFQSLENLQKKHILVHCTHGHNRTGYMIVHFLMRTQLMSVTEAIAKFAEARPPGIYKPDYIDALYAFYHEKKPRNITYPLVPEWKRSSEFDLNDDHDDGVSDFVTFQNNQEMNANMTNDDVLGDDIPVEQLNILRQECYQMLNLSLKWKYPEMNSVDFLFEAGPGVQQSLYLFDRGKKRILDGSSVVFSDGDTCSFSGKIIECSYNSEKEVWEFMRVRPDKSTPNEFSTFCKVMKSIKDNITEDVVLDKICEIVKLPSYVYRTNSDIEAHRKRQKLTDQ